MAAKRAEIEWTVCADDNEWRDCVDSAQSTDPAGSAWGRRISRRAQLLSLCLLCCALSLAAASNTLRAGPRVAAAQAHTLRFAEAEGYRTASATAGAESSWSDAGVDPLSPDAWRGWLPREERFLGFLTGQEAAQLNFEPRLVQIHGDLAAVDLVASDGPGQVYHQTRFYRRYPEGWLRTAPVNALWGDPMALETDHLRVHFRARDRRAVEAVLERVDRNYTEMREFVGLPPDPAGGAKAIMEVSVEEMPIFRQAPYTQRVIVPDRIRVPSPALLARPETISAGEVLHQSLVLNLGEQLLLEHRALHPEANHHLQLLLFNLLRLRLIWETDGLLAAGSDGLRQAVLTGGKDNAENSYVMNPGYATDLCIGHSVLAMLPEMLGLPVTCGGAGPAVLLPLPALNWRESLYDRDYTIFQTSSGAQAIQPFWRCFSIPSSTSTAMRRTRAL
ncbi:MAG: hypothetical protein HC802_14840 [Caldilineaceae bacterium]|nr:hypothetical protein [Caldilineaceae bacterium]